MTARRRVLSWGLFLLLAGVAGACKGVIDPSDNQIREFTGTLPVGGQKTHDFNVGRNGEFEVKITALTPNPDAFLGLAYGPIVNGQCSAYPPNYFAQINRIALAGPITSGPYCLLVFDVGSLAQPANYTLRVSHP
jgi:hypothetical protein